MTTSYIGWWCEETFDDGIWWVGRCGMPATQQLITFAEEEE